MTGGHFVHQLVIGRGSGMGKVLSDIRNFPTPPYRTWKVVTVGGPPL